MNTCCAPAATIPSPPADIRLPARLLARWVNLTRAALARWSARAARARDVDAFDRLDQRALRDIGADWLLNERHVQCERDEMQWRIDSQFRG